MKEDEHTCKDFLPTKQNNSNMRTVLHLLLLGTPAAYNMAFLTISSIFDFWLPPFTSSVPKLPESHDLVSRLSNNDLAPVSHL